jgi:hypothetical protein
MTLLSLKSYITNRLTDAGFTEWVDPFGDDNIPSSIIDMAFHQRPPVANLTGAAHGTASYLAEVQVKLYFKGYNNPDEAVKSAITKTELAISSLSNQGNYDPQGLAEVTVPAFSIDPYVDEVNDNIVVSTVTISGRVVICLDN